MADQNTNGDLVKDFERVVKKAIEANTTYYKEAAAALQNLYSGKTELSGSNVMESLSEAWTSLVKLQLRYAENLYDLQLHWSKNMAHQPAPAAAPQQTNIEPVPERKVMTMTGESGQSLEFLLHFNSRDAETRHCKFILSGFVDAANGAAAPLLLVCEPESFVLIPGQTTEVRFSVNIPETAGPGAYRNTVTVAGYDDSIFDLIVVVQPPAEKADTPPVEKMPKSARRSSSAIGAKPKTPRKTS
ncbi:MAG: hypothetical protein IAE84_17320 [Saprospiraceae bacterium]|nr:hypothetical protein [Saprospiraceae bacterium]HRD80061.1 hypothetical protein [Saprospiraceae bacterium]